MPEFSYDGIASIYTDTDRKPDKRYSIIETAVALAGDVTDKTILDAGCGSGPFSRRFPSAKVVYAWDRSEQQLEIAKQTEQLLSGVEGGQVSNIRYHHGDIFTDTLPAVDLISAPFVLNYAPSVAALEQIFLRFCQALPPDGRVIGVVDLPNGRDLRQYGAYKRLLGPAENGTLIEITVYDDLGKKICILPSPIYYYTQETIQQAATKAGFTLSWHRPMVSDEGYERYGVDYWTDYLTDPELGYLVAQKSKEPPR